MGKAAVVLWPTGIEMVKQLLPRLALTTSKVLIRKGPQQQFCLIEPTGMRRGIHGSQARMGSEVGFRVVVNRGPAVIHDHLQAPRTAVAVSHLPHAPQEVGVV